MAVNPLAEYLARYNISQTEFARRVAKARNWRTWPSEINRWARGERVPNRHNRRAIAKASHGRVPAKAWGE